MSLWYWVQYDVNGLEISGDFCLESGFMEEEGHFYLCMEKKKILVWRFKLRIWWKQISILSSSRNSHFDFQILVMLFLDQCGHENQLKSGNWNNLLPLTNIKAFLGQVPLLQPIFSSTTKTALQRVQKNSETISKKFQDLWIYFDELD